MLLRRQQHPNNMTDTDTALALPVLPVALFSLRAMGAL
jgi:hypothetical protein